MKPAFVLLTLLVLLCGCVRSLPTPRFHNAEIAEKVQKLPSFFPAGNCTMNYSVTRQRAADAYKKTGGSANSANDFQTFLLNSKFVSYSSIICGESGDINVLWTKGVQYDAMIYNLGTPEDAAKFLTDLITFESTREKQEFKEGALGPSTYGLIVNGSVDSYFFAKDQYVVFIKNFQGTNDLKGFSEIVLNG